MIKPILREFQNLTLESIEQKYQYLPTVLHQIKEHKDRFEGVVKRRKQESSKVSSSAASPLKLNESNLGSEAININV